MEKISAYTIAYNEGKKIRATLSTLHWVDEIIVVDSHSTDDTVAIAESMGARVVQVDFQGFGHLRNEALKACSHPWIFSLDADERCTPAVAEEIRRIISHDDQHATCDIYFVPRRNYFLGRWIKHSGWYPNYRQPQLFRRGAMSYDMKQVHEGYIAHSSRMGYLQQAIWQIPYANLEESIRKMNRYSTLGTARLAHKKVSMPKAFWHGFWAFIKHYVFKLGCLDGWAGFVIAFNYLQVTFYLYAKEVEKRNHWDTPPASMHDLPSSIVGDDQSASANKGDN